MSDLGEAREGVRGLANFASAASCLQGKNPNRPFPGWYNRFVNGKQVEMTSVDFKLSLSDQLRREAEAAGLLSPKAIERLLREELRRRRANGLFAAANRLSALDLPPLTDGEIAEEIRRVRKPTGA
jgi:hypothetical protein